MNKQYQDAVSDKRMLTITKAVLYLKKLGYGVSTQTLRRWDATDYFKPTVRIRGTRYRVYDPKELERLARKLER